MATAPMKPAAAPMEESLMGAMGDEGLENKGEVGYSICICVKPDGSISVGVSEEDDYADEGMGEAGEGGEKEGYQPARDIKDALTKALEIYRQNGVPQDSSTMQAEFKSGFEGKGRM